MEWLQKDSVFTCPKCGYSFEHEGYTAFFNFCPCCGIVMNERTVKPKTNADVIREMTTDQLADFISRCEINEIDYAHTYCDLCDFDNDCMKCLKIWLDTPADKTFGLLYEFKPTGDAPARKSKGAAENENCADNA